MMQFNVKAEFGDMFKRLNELDRRLREVVIARSLNRTGEAVKTQAKKSISSTYNITSTKVGERLRVSRTFAGGNLTVTVRVASKFGRRATNLITFNAREIGKRKGVKVKIRKDRGFKQSARWFILRNNKTGGRFVGRRVGPHRTKDIESVTTGDVPQMFNARAVNAALLNRARQVFAAEFARQFARARSGLM